MEGVADHLHIPVVLKSSRTCIQRILTYLLPPTS